MWKKFLLAGFMIGAVVPCLLPGSVGMPAAAAAAAVRPSSLAVAWMDKASIVWPLVPGAVQYQLVILSGPENTPDAIVTTKDHIYANGYELDTSMMGVDKQDYYWSVCGLDLDGSPIGNFTEPQPLRETVLNGLAPIPTTEFDQMAYAPLYPVYSWIPYLRAASYEVQIWKKGSGPHDKDRRIQRLYTDNFCLYDDAGYTDPGVYWWQVRALDGAGQPLSDWSPKRDFVVTAPVVAAALGDSITHGGGAVSTPPGYRMYDWETYSPVAVKNLGFSGNTVQAMNDRFETDVLPFAPKVLVIMGGVNDYRAGTSADAIIAQLAAIRDKCTAQGIIPVFATATPINPDCMARVPSVEEPAGNWMLQQFRENIWIMKQKYAVDVAAALTDPAGNLRADYTTDGLHPDRIGKKYIGETIGRYLLATFPDLFKKQR